MGVPGFFAWILKNYKKSKMITNVTKNEELKESGMRAQILAGIIMPIITFMNNLIYLVYRYLKLLQLLHLVTQMKVDCMVKEDFLTQLTTLNLL